MADTRFRQKSDVLPIRVEAGQLILPETVGSRIENMFLTEEGTLRSVWGPAPYVPDYGNGFPTYNNLKGIFHARLGPEGEKDILLIQDSNEIKVFEGWEAGSATPNDVWDILVGPAATADLQANIGFDSKPRFPCQFESTPNGIVIIPAGESSRAFFYDGDTVLPLGYATAPDSPSGMGPDSSGTLFYDHDGGNLPTWAGNGRVGSLALDSVSTTNLARTAEAGYQCAVQWIDLWGNLSPLSGRSSTVVIPGSQSSDTPDEELKVLFWTGIDTGPQGTVGRILSRTRDVLNSGTLDLFEMRNYFSGGFLSASTMPDNIGTGFPDNIPDSLLLSEPKNPVAVTPFKLYTLAFGRGWAANFEDEPGKLHPSLPGRWGTFLENEEIYPDPRGAEITGMCQIQDGLLVFTENTTFLIVISFGGEGFQTKTLHPTIGCVAPSSIKTLPNGQAIWLGREGFYSCTGSGDGLTVQLVSRPISAELRKITRSRALQSAAAVDVREKRYRCWVPMEGSLQNNVCWEFDGQGWARRTEVKAADVCVTQDHRTYMLTAGTSRVVGNLNDLQGVWLLDHEVQSWNPTPRAARIQTCWLRSGFAGKRGSPTTIYFWFREMSSGTINIEIQRDWKSKVIYTETAPLHPTDDVPPFWGSAIYGGNDPEGNPWVWEKRRPYWTRVDVAIPSCEVFRLNITLSKELFGDDANPGFWDFIGMSFDEVPHPDTFRSYPK